MPVFDQSHEECAFTDEDGGEYQVLLIRGCVVLGDSRSARFRIHVNHVCPHEHWVLELTSGNHSGKTVLLLGEIDRGGISIRDHDEEARDSFPLYDPAHTLSREQVFSQNLDQEIFALSDEISLQDSTLIANQEYWIRQLFYDFVGPFYVEDALLVAPRLQGDQVPCSYFVDVGEEWQSVTWEQLQQAGRREVCTIMIPREHQGTASYHMDKTFPKGTRYYHESDTGGDDWHDENTYDDVEMLEKLRSLELEKTDLARQKSALLEEVDAVQREIIDPQMNWRMDALQKAQRENRRLLAEIESRLQSVEQSIEEIP